FSLTYAQPHQTPRETTNSSLELKNPRNLIYFPTSDGRPNVVFAGTSSGEEPFTALNDRHRQFFDIPPSSSSEPRSFAVLGDTIYFFATTNINGATEELWASWRLFPSRTATMNVINPGGDSEGGFMIAFQDSLYFAAQGSNNNVELWHSNGVRDGSGTTLAGNEINPTTSSFPEDLFGIMINGTKPMVFFSADETSGSASGFASQNRELWVRDLDRGLNYQVQDINPGTLAGSDPRFFTAYSDRCFFIANDGASFKLYRSDGTSGGTVAITLPGGAIVDENVAPVASGGRLYFAASDGSGNELWAYDFVTDQANRVANINPGAANANPHNLTDVNGILYFAADSTGIGIELFRSSGTSASTYSIQDIGGIRSSNPSNITNVGGNVYFFSDDIGNGTGVLRFSDPAERSTVSFYSFDGNNGASVGTFGQMLAL
ncbi:MAG: hypothetical protein AAFU64_15635, partial [Bacteroidota bacterium]